MRNIIFAALLLIANGCSSVPITGRRQLSLMSSSQEMAMGEKSYRELLKKETLSSDKDLVEMIRRVGNRLAAAADKPEFNWEFNLIENDKAVNAFCLPGGKVAFYTDILPITIDETGLAVVLGHAIAHAQAPHGADTASPGPRSPPG